MALSDLVVNISGNAQGLKKSISGAGSALRGFGGVVRTVSAGVNIAFKSMAFAAGGLYAAFRALGQLDQFGELAGTQIQAERKLAAIFKATAGAAGISADEVKRFASERQKLTNFGDETTIDAAALLGTFTNVKGDAFKRSLIIMQDMAAAMGTDLAGGAIQVGKAMNDPILGVGALSELGVSFTYQQKALIKTLVESNKMFEAQSVILDELQREFGGVAEAMASPLTQAANLWSDFGEQIGFIWNDVRAKLLEGFGFGEFVSRATKTLEDFRKDWMPEIKLLLLDVGDEFGRGFKKIAASLGLEDFDEGFRGFVEKLKSDWVPALVDGIDRAAESIRDEWIPVIKDLLKQLPKAIAFLKDLALGLARVAAKIIPILDKIKLGFQGSAHFATSMASGMSIQDAAKSWAQELKKKEGIQTRLEIGTDGKLVLKRFGDDVKAAADAAKKSTPFSAKEIARFKREEVLYQAELARRRAAADAAKKPPEPPKPQRLEPAAVNRSIEVGTQQAYEKIFSALSGNKADKKQPEKETADNTKDLLAETKTLRRLWEKLEQKLSLPQAVELVG